MVFPVSFFGVVHLVLTFSVHIILQLEIDMLDFLKKGHKWTEPDPQQDLSGEAGQTSGPWRLYYLPGIALFNDTSTYVLWGPSIELPPSGLQDNLFNPEPQPK